jgi:cytochrome c oxidase cbb3-type subunit 3
MRTLLLAACLLGLALPARAEGDAQRGKLVYQVYCVQCHGVEGNGRGINAGHISVIPRDHTDTGEMSARTDEELFKAIKFGGKSINKSVLMPAWGRTIADEDIHSLVAYLRGLCCNKN